MSEETFVLHSAPTLAGIKTGSLFSIPCNNKRCVVEKIRKLNQVLTPKGIRTIPLEINEKRCLIYVYRPKKLQQDMKHEQAIFILKELGYPLENIDLCITYLIQRLKGKQEFPHEIGLFLGYPPEDVKGFIEHHARDYKEVGSWKVYGNEKLARNQFKRFEQCTKDYAGRMQMGCDLKKLVV